MAWQLQYSAPPILTSPLDGAVTAPTPKTLARRAALPAAVRKLLATVAPATLLVVLFLAFWQFLIPQGVIPGIPAQFLGSPSGIVSAFHHLLVKGYTGESLWDDFTASVLRALTGVGLAILVGVPTGVAIGLNRFVDRLLSPLVSFLLPIPSIAFIPVVVIWFGIGQTSKVLVIFLGSLMFITIGSALGVRRVPTDYYFVARNYHLGLMSRLRHVVVPVALPQILAAIRTGLMVGWATVVAAELIGGNSGLGYIISNAGQVFDVDTVYVGIILIGAVGVVFEYGFRLLEKRLLHWQVAR